MNRDKRILVLYQDIEEYYKWRDRVYSSSYDHIKKGGYLYQASFKCMEISWTETYYTKQYKGDHYDLEICGLQFEGFRFVDGDYSSEAIEYFLSRVSPRGLVF